MKLKTGRKILSFLLTIALLVGLMQGLGLTGFTYDDNPYAALVPTSSDDSNALNDKLISFNGNMWYIIEDNSTAVNSGTVTLLHATFLAKVPFSSSRDHTAYKDSSIEGFLNGYYEGSFAQFSNAIVPTDLNDVNVTGAKLYLLSTAEVQSLPDNIKKIGCDWWLRTQGNMQCGTFVGEFGNIENSVTYVTSSLAARPALRLDLSKVIFSDKTFSLDEDHNFTYTASGSTITAVCSAENCSLPLVDGRHTATLTIAAPKHNTYGDGKEAAAVITDAYRIRGDAKISYQKEIGSNYGTASETAPTDVGNYKASITIGSATASIEYTIAKAETEVQITVEPENSVYGQEISITATVDEDAKIIMESEDGSEIFGGASLYLDGTNIESLGQGTNTVTFTISNFDAGEHTIKVVYNGDEHYEFAESETVTINVVRTEPEITVTAEDITYGEAVQATVTVPDNATGSITAGLLKYGGIDPNTNEEIWNAVNGVPASITSGDQFEISGLAAGDYKLTVSLGEDSNYFSGSAEKTFKVNKAEPDMSVTVDPQTPVADGDFTVTTHLPSDAQGNVIYRFSDVDLLGYTTVTNGEAPFDFECLRSGTYHGTAKYLPADGSNYAEKEITFEFNVSVADPNMTLTAPDVDYGKTATVTANLPLNAMWCDVTFYLDGSETGKSVYVSQGKAVCEYMGLSIGEHTVKAKFSGDDRYFSVTKEISFTVNSVDCALTINYVYADGTEAAETYTDSVEIFKEYSVESPEITGCTPDIATVEGTMGDEDMDGKTVTVTYTANTYKVTYVVDGEKLTEMDATFGQSVPRPRTPQREGYSFKWVDEIPATMPAENITINGKFTVIEYTATFVDENGETVEEVKFTVETEKLDEPDVPEKTGYAGEWEEYTLGTSDITIKPVYANITSIQIEDYEENSETGYKEDKTFTVKADDLPEGAEVHWFVNGEDVGTGESYTVEDPTDDYNIYAEVIDKDGNTLDTTKVQSVKVRNGFFDRLKAFFSELIEKILGKAIADLLSSIC
ncbi:MAG: Ig-like domain repeat protein [Clostridia bacterium]|nr:Ig-like domain repeat protein [Clostridia bacterium]